MTFVSHVLVRLPEGRNLEVRAADREDQVELVTKLGFVGNRTVRRERIARSWWTFQAGAWVPFDGACSGVSVRG